MLHRVVFHGCSIISKIILHSKKNLYKNFEYIYIAPPQYEEMWWKALKLVDENADWLTEDGTAIVQIDLTEYQKVDLQNLVEAEQRKYGSTLLIFYDKT